MHLWKRGNDNQHMNQIMKQTCRFLYGAILIAACLVLTLVPSFRKADLYLDDRIYQQGYSVSNRNIVILAIDEETIDHLGPVGSWNREKYAKVLEKLTDGGYSPAVIGIDIIYDGPYDGNTDNSEDQELAETAADLGSVVIANTIAYNEKGEPEWGTLYPLLKDAVNKQQILQGFTLVSEDILGNYEYDNTIRHALLWDSEGNKSFAYQIAQKYSSGQLLQNLNTNTIYLQFAAKSNADHLGAAFERVSFWDVYNGSVDAARFNGRIVLIGAYADGLQDEWSVAIDSSGKMFGVEVQANIINALTDPNYHNVREISDVLQMIFLTCILCLLLIVIVTGKLRRTIIASMLFLSGGILLDFEIKSLGYLIHVLWLPVGIILLCIYGICLHYRDEHLQKIQIRMQFGRYVDEKVLRILLKDSSFSGQLKGVRKNVAVLFVDICGFTSLSESKPPEEIVQILNQYFEMITNIVAKYSGTIDKFIGDAAMVVWNIPEEQEEYLKLALLAGKEMTEQAELLSQKTGVDLKLAVGIESGNAVVGNIGSFRRMDYTTIGDTVNTASRLESLKISGTERGNQVYISGNTFSQAHEYIQAEFLGEYHLKGKGKPVEIYRVTKIKRSETV